MSPGVTSKTHCRKSERRETAPPFRVRDPPLSSPKSPGTRRSERTRETGSGSNANPPKAGPCAGACRMALGEACHSPRPREGTCLGHTEHMTRPPRRPQAPGAQAFAPYSSKYFRRDFKPVGHSRRPPGRPLRPTGPHEICLQAGARKFQKPKAAVRSDSTAVTAPGAGSLHVTPGVTP